MGCWRWLLCALVGASACSSERLTIELSPELIAPGVKTLVLARTGDGRAESLVIDRAMTSDGMPAALEPYFTESSEPGARLFAIGYRETLADLDLRAGSTEEDRGARVEIPGAPMLQLVHDLGRASGWQPAETIPQELRDEGLPGVEDPLGCSQIVAAVTRPEDLPEIRWSFHAVAATGPETAVILGQECSSEGSVLGCAALGLSDAVFAFEVGPVRGVSTASVTIRRAPLPTSGYIHSAEYFDGKVWAAGSDGTLVVLDRRGRLLSSSAPSTVTGLRLDARGALIGFGPAGVIQFVAGSTVARVISNLPLPTPRCLESSCPTAYPRLAFDGPQHMLFVDPHGSFHRFDGSSWQRLAPPDASLGRDVLIHAGHELALSEALLYRHVEGSWQPVSKSSGAYEYRGLYADTQGRLLTHGTLGRVSFHPSADRLSRGCPIVLGNLRPAASMSVDDSGRTAFLVDSYDTSPSEGSALVRLTLPSVAAGP